MDDYSEPNPPETSPSVKEKGYISRDADAAIEEDAEVMDDQEAEVKKIGRARVIIAEPTGKKPAVSGEPSMSLGQLDRNLPKPKREKNKLTKEEFQADFEIAEQEALEAALVKTLEAERQATTSWLQAISRGTKKVATNARELFTEAAKALDLHADDLSHLGLVDWSRGMLSMRGKKGEYVNLSTETEDTWFDAYTPEHWQETTAQPSVAGHTLESIKAIREKISGTPGEAWTGVTEVLSALAHSMNKNVVDRNVSEHVDSSEELDLQEDLKALAEADQTSPEGKMKHVLLEAYAGTAEISNFLLDGLKDWKKDAAQVFPWIAEQYRHFESLPRQGIEQNHQAEIARLSIPATVERLDTFSAEVSDGVAVAEAAKKTLLKTVIVQREAYLKTFDDVQEKAALLTRQIAKDKVGGYGVELLKMQKRKLEREIADYQDKIAGLEAPGSRVDYQAMLDEANTKLTERSRLLKNPALIKGKAREMIKQEMSELEAKMDSYEFIMSNLDKLDNLTPDVRKESATA